MKKLIVGCLCLAALASCDVKKSDEYKTLQAEKDSLMRVNTDAGNEMAEMMTIINEVEENFNQIKEAEKYLTVEAKADGQISADKRSRIKDDFALIQEIMAKNKTEIAKLNQKIKNGYGEVANLKKTIERLNSELIERAQNIIDLQESLKARDQRIADLETNLKALEGDVENLSSHASEQASILKEQDMALNTAFYMFGTSRELKDANVIAGGFLKSTKILTDGIEKSKFIQMDIREKQDIAVFSKKAKLLSDHPEDSYAFNKDANGNIVIKILDYNRFWSLTKFLIVEVN